MISDLMERKIKGIKEEDKETLKSFNPIYYIEYEYLDESGDCRPTIVQEDDQVYNLKSLIRWMVNKIKYTREFRILFIKKMSYLTNNEKDDIDRHFRKAWEKDHKEQMEKLEKAKEAEKKRKETEKRIVEEAEYNQYLKLKKKFENKNIDDILDSQWDININE